MRTPLMNKTLLIISLLFCSIGHAEPWPEHQENIQRIERDLYKFQQELEVMVDRKKKTRDRARIEETLQRIVEIHSELISLRTEMDNQRKHLKAEHPGKANILDNFNIKKSKHKKKKLTLSPLDKKLDRLLIKIQLKFSSFMKAETKKKEMLEVENVVKIKKRKKKEREADVYLRRKSKVKLVK